MTHTTAIPSINSASEAMQLQPHPTHATEATCAHPTILPDVALVLNSTIVEATRRIAHINGQAFTVGEDIPMADKFVELGTMLRLIEVASGRVILQCGDERIELTIPEPMSAVRINFPR